MEKSQPRLQSATKLVSAGAVRVLDRSGEQSADIEITSGDMTYFVRLRPDGDRCTCPWFARHQGQRGPCKHVLAARMVLEQMPKDSPQ